MKVTILVSEMDNQGMILFTLHALCTQNYPEELYEIIVPDMGTFCAEDRALIARLQEQFPQLKILKDPSKNRAELFNLAAKQAKGELFCLIESHCYAHKNWIANYVNLFKKERFDLAAGTFKTVPTDSPVGHAQDEFFNEVCRRIEKQKVKWSYFDCHNSAITRTCYEKLNGMDVRLPNMCEFELGARGCELGLSILRTPTNLVWHFNDNRLSNYSKIVHWQGIDRTRMLIIHGPEFIRKYFPNPRFVKLLPYLTRLRPIFLAATLSLVYLSRIGIMASRLLKLKKQSARFFMHHAENSVRYGMIKGLKNSNQVR